MKTMHWRWISNGVLLLIATVLLILFEVGVLPTYKGGFYCNDPALSFIPGDETVPDEMLFIVSLFGAIIVICFNEMIKHVSDMDGYSFSKFLQDMNLAFIWLRGFILVMIMGLSVVEFIKFTVGTPRPTFLEVCVPDKAINCTTGQYIEHYECTGTKYSHHTVLDNNRSFLSGHAMTSLYTGLFLFWYVQQRCGGPWLWVVMQQLLSILWGVIGSLSRIIDHRHHWWDVLAGSIFAGIITIYSVTRICNNFKDPPKPSQFFRYLQENYDKDNKNVHSSRNNIV